MALDNIENYRLVDGTKIDNLPADTQSELDLKLDSVVGWTYITVDNTDANNPIISAAWFPWTWDVVWPASATDNAIARFDSTTGKLLQDSWVIISDTDNVTWVVDLTLTWDLTIPDDWLFDGTNTDASILVNDGTNYNPVVMSWDATMSNTGVVSVTETGKTKVTTNDTTPWFLDDKIVKSSWIIKTILNPWADEQVEIKMWPHYLSIASSGLYSGWVLSAWTVGTFSYTAWEALHVDNSTFPTVIPASVSFSAWTNVAITNILTQPVTYIMIDSAGNPVQLTLFPTPEQRRDNIFLWVVVHSDNTTVNAINLEPDVALDVVAQLHDLMAWLQAFNLQWNRITANGANLSMDKSAGKLFRAGINFATNVKDPHTATLALQTLATFRYRNQDGSEGSNITVLDPTTYDNAGTTTTVPSNNNATIQRVYTFPTGIIRVQRGQEVFSNLSSAIDAVGKEVFITEDNIEENGLLLASIVMKKTASDLTDSGEAIIFVASRFWELGSVGSSATTTLQQAYNNATNPEIITDATLWAVSIKRWSAADTDDVLEILNWAWTQTASIDGNWVITWSNLSWTNTWDQSTIVGITWTLAQFNTAVTDATLATGWWTVTGTSSGTNTWDQTSVTGNSWTTDALNSATTVVDVSAATAPTTWQVLTATSSTAATWQDAAAWSWATAALDNLVAVAINTSLISDTDNTDDLGSDAIGWKDTYTRTVKMDGSTSGTTTVQATAVAGTTTLTLPAATDTLVWKATTDTLTNKTITSGVYDGDFTVERTATAVSANSAAETIIWVTSTAAARTITLDTDDVVAGRMIIIKDESWAAGTNNITIATEGAETIDWVSTITITVNYWVARVYSNGTNWFTF